MRAPAFWWLPRPNAKARLLAPLGGLYGAATLRRMARSGVCVGLPIICVGNFVAGGAGKTPTTLALATMLEALGETPFVLTRGYGGRLAGPVEVNPAGHDADETGDEPLLLAAHQRTIVSRDRPAGAMLAHRLGATVVLMDDGLQNPSLHKDLRIGVVDARVGIGNGLSLPAGPLRAPLAGQFGYTDLVLLIGTGGVGDIVATQARAAGVGVERARLVLDAEQRARLAGRRVLAVSGIGRPEKFAETLHEAGANLLGHHSFGDHHRYTAADVEVILNDARQRDCTVVTTEKDLTKLARLWPEGEAERLLAVPVSLRFDNPEAIRAILAKTLARARSGAAGPA